MKIIKDILCLEKIGKTRGCLISGGNVDIQKGSKCFLDDLKNGKIGKITYDKIEEET